MMPLPEAVTAPPKDDFDFSMDDIDEDLGDLNEYAYDEEEDEDDDEGEGPEEAQ